MPEFDRVSCEGLSKRYGRILALKSVTETFHAGTVSTLLGDNGSGKSTLLSCLALRIRPNRGTLHFGNHQASPQDTRLLRHIGWAAHEPMLYEPLSGRENLLLSAKLFAIQNASTRLQELIESLSLGSWLERRVETYSKGQRQRVALARALVHTPKLLILDEPASGLDLRSIESLNRILRKEKERGAIIILSTHKNEVFSDIVDKTVTLNMGISAGSTR